MRSITMRVLKQGLAATAAALVLAGAAPALAAGGSYASVNGLKMYYEVQGNGRPLVLLHGGVCTIEVCLGKLRPALAKGHRTIAIEQQGHGRTADIDRPLSAELMAEDTVAVLQQLGIRNADFFGYSMGGSIALQIALKHPELVRKVAVIGTAFDNDGLIPGLVDNLKVLKAEDVPQQFRDAYVKVAPDPKGWPALVAKIGNMLPHAKGLTPDDIKSIKAPVLVMLGDADIVRPEHAVQVFRQLPQAQLAVLPGADHFAPMQHADWVGAMTRAFFDAPLSKPKE